MTGIEERSIILLIALLLDALVGDPDWLWKRIPHPVAVMGNAISILDHHLNHDAHTPLGRRLAGVLAVIVLFVAFALLGWALSALAANFKLGIIIEIAIVAILLAHRSLYNHVMAVAHDLELGGLKMGREAVKKIVGRDPASLDEAGVARAAIESAAENFADGVVAPAFWYLVTGLPGVLVYKLINTADSMIGHKSERYLQFGWAAARVDDLANWLPARISGVLISFGAVLLPTCKAREALRTMRQDASKHNSPNAGWPEAAMAGALGLALAGPRR